MRVGSAILDLARAAGARSLFVVGTGKSVGKTTALNAIYRATGAAGLRVAVASTGPTPPLRLEPGTAFATARSLLAPSPASSILELSSARSPTGPMLYARVEQTARLELSGPSTASGLRQVVGDLERYGDLVIVDGAIDRVAALAASNGAIVLSCGAADAATADESVEDVAGLVARLGLPKYDPGDAFVDAPGALTAAGAAAWIDARETRQIVIDDPTQVAITGRALRSVLSRLRVRCRRPLRVIAVTVCALAGERSFEPAAFARAVARATALPTFDVFAGTLHA